MDNPELHNNDINTFQTASDIIIQKSTKEGFGLTVTEAMWKGAVVIAGDVGRIRLQIQNGRNGFLVKNSIQLAERIRYVLNNPKLKTTIGKAVHETVLKKYLLPHGLLKNFKLYRLYFKE